MNKDTKTIPFNCKYYYIQVYCKVRRSADGTYIKQGAWSQENPGE